MHLIVIMLVYVDDLMVFGGNGFTFKKYVNNYA